MYIKLANVYILYWNIPYKTICKHINYQYKKAIHIFDNKELSMFINTYYIYFLSSLSKKNKTDPCFPPPFFFSFHDERESSFEFSVQGNL